MATLLQPRPAVLKPEKVKPMKTLKWLLAGALVGIIAVAFRDFERGAWLTPQLSGAGEPAGPEEPVLGYDGMDQETLLDWLTSAHLDSDALEHMLSYEAANRNRGPVIDLIEDLLG